MKIYIYSDIQGIELALPSENPDLIFLLGDIYWRDVEKIDEKYNCPKLGVLGNHDRLDTFEGTDIIDIHKKSVEVGGLKISGFGGSPFYNHKPSSPQYSDAEVMDFVMGMESVDIFLAHANPAMASVEDKTDAHRGFLGLTKLLEEEKAKYLFHGHLHVNEIYEYNRTNVCITHGLRVLEI